MAYVKRDEEDNRLGEQDSERTAYVLRHEFLDVDFDFLLLCVDAPVLCQATELGSLVDQNHGRVSLLQEEKVESKGGEAHDASDVFRPSPAKIRSRDEAADEGGQERTHEYCGGKGGNGKTTDLVVKHVRHNGTDDSQGARSKEAAKEATDHNSL